MEGSEGELREAHAAGLARGTRVDRQAGPLAKEPLGGTDGTLWEHSVRELFKQE